jgi:hypothetical protein
MVSYSFSIQNAVDLLRALNAAVDDYLTDPLSSRKAVICAMFSWHLVDWVHQEYPAVAAKFPKLTDYQLHLKSECKSLSYMQDITTGTKHRTITWYLPAVKKAEEHRGAFSNAFSKAFDVSCLQLTLTDGIFVYFDEEVTKVRDYWNTYFTDTLEECV